MPVNWDDIKRCPIWKVLGVTECDNCKTVVQCWGEETILKANDNSAIKAIKKAIETKEQMNAQI